MGRRRKLRKILKDKKNRSKKRSILIQCKLIDKMIFTEKQKVITNNIRTEIQKLKVGGGINSGAFWEFKKRMEKNKHREVPTAIIGKDKELKTTKEEIKKEYENFYSNLFTKTEIIDKRGKEMIDIKMRNLKKIAKQDKETITDISVKELRENINNIKNKRTIDKQGINNVMIKNGGEDFVNSLILLFNDINKHKESPDEWIQMIINTIYKGKGDKKDLENRRGLFITNCISKLYDKIKLARNTERLNIGISKFQCGGMKGKSTIDHIMTLNAIIDYNIYIGSETYTIFADAYKCFDKLNLKDCVCDISKIIGAKEALEIYNMNKKGTVTIKTPIGVIENIKADEIVRQGTINGPKLCCVNTDQINKIGRKCYTYIGSEIKIETMTYVDDIQNSSSNEEGLKKTVSNLQLFENTKGYTFSVDKKKTAILITGKKKNKNYEDIKLRVKNEQIKYTNEYKYLGQWYNEKGDHKTTIQKKKEKIEFFIQQIKYYGNEYKIGKYAMTTRIKIYKDVIVPTVFHNIETWSRITKDDINELESMQERMVKSMCEQMISTPYFGLLAEIGVWPIEQQLHYRQILLFHNIVITKETRLITEIIKNQMKEPWKGCWIEEVQKTCKKYNLDINKIPTWTKRECKNTIKKKIEDELNAKVKNLAKEKTKLRFLNDYSLKPYIKNLEFKECITIIKLRLNMIETKCNFKGNYIKTNYVRYAKKT